MGSGSDVDDDFNDIYKEYTGPKGPAVSNVPDKEKANKEPVVESDDDDMPRDPNAVPTDFTSREAKVWEAKSKATERNWKKRKEEEMICKICNQPGHFTQGCPSTLGMNRKSQDFLERVPVRDKNVKALFTDKVLQKIEKEVGCKVKMEEKFLIVSGKDRLVLAKGVDAVHSVISRQETAGNKKGSSHSPTPTRHPQNHPPTHTHPRLGRNGKVVDDRTREEVHRMSKGGSSQAAYGKGGGGGGGGGVRGAGFGKGGSYDDRSATLGPNRDLKLGYTSFPQTLEELEVDYRREAMELGTVRDREEDDENYRHREAIREMRESYMKKLSILRSTQAKQWGEFLEMEVERRQQHQMMASSGFGRGGYKQMGYHHHTSEYEMGGTHYTSSGGYNHDGYGGGFQNQRVHQVQDVGKGGSAGFNQY